MTGDLRTVGIGRENIRRINFFHFGIGGGRRRVDVGEDAKPARIRPLDVNGLRSFGVVCRLKQELDPDRNGANEVRIFADGFAKGDDIAVGEWGRDLGGENYGNGVSDLE